MKQQTETVVFKDGSRGNLLNIDQNKNGDPQALVELDNGRRIYIPMNLLQSGDDRTYYLPITYNELERQTFDATSATAQDGEELVIPVYAETVQVQKREVERGTVEIRKRVVERQETVNQPLMYEDVDIQRIPLNEWINEPAQVRYEGETMIVPVMEEVLVVEKRLMVKEELRITKKRLTTNQEQTVTLRTEEIDVQNLTDEQNQNLNAV
jgi:uncharacterized protein (TIGR02271 family)